jgi:hypothetical protein
VKPNNQSRGICAKPNWLANHLLVPPFHHFISLHHLRHHFGSYFYFGINCELTVFLALHSHGPLDYFCTLRILLRLFPSHLPLFGPLILNCSEHGFAVLLPSNSEILCFVQLRLTINNKGLLYPKLSIEGPKTFRIGSFDARIPPEVSIVIIIMLITFHCQEFRRASRYLRAMKGDG